MRLVAFLDLVVRRVWAKRGLLAGSLVGATLVTALLVVVPLYDASVQAVDLRFTLTGAQPNEVDISAFADFDDYDAALGEQYRTLFEAQRAQRIDEWYPTVEERIRSRTFVVIPTGPEYIVDWVAAGEAWKEEVTRLFEEEGEDAEFPPPPYPTPPREATNFRVLTGPDITDRLTVVAGEWPERIDDLSDGSNPMPIVLGADLAAVIDREVGDVFIARPFPSAPQQFELARVAAIVEPIDAEDLYWGVDSPLSSAFFDLTSFEALTRGFPVDPESDPWARNMRGYQGLPATQRFVLPLDRDSLQLEEVPGARNALGGLAVDLGQDTAGRLIVSTPINGVLDRFDVRSVVIGAPILAMLALVVGGALYFLIFTAALSLEREGPELALLRSRGASYSQTVGIHVAQSAVVATLAALLAPVIARALIAVTGRVPPLSDLTGGGFLDVTQTESLVPYMLIGALVTFVSMGLAVFPFARKRVLELRSLAARPTQTSIWQRYNLDLFAIALSLVLLAQLVQRGFIIRDGAEVTLDPLAVAFPVLLLFTGALVLLRLLPLLLRFAGYLMTRARGLSMALPGWHLGRNPVPYGRLALLVWITAGFGAFALTYANTLDTSFNDRAVFVSGTDLRVIGDDIGFTIPPDELTTAAVYRSAGGPLRSASRPAELIAVDPSAFAEVVAWRDDFAAEGPREEFARLRPDGPPDLGVELPASATALHIDGLVAPRDLRTQATSTNLPDQSMRVMLKIFDARARAWTFQADADLVDTGWSVVDVDLSAPLNDLVGGVEPPLVLHSIWFERSKRDPGRGDLAVTNNEFVLMADITVSSSEGEASILDDVLGELEADNGLQVETGVDADYGVTALYRAVPESVDPPTMAERAASPLSREGTVVLFNLPVRVRADQAVPELRKPTPTVNVIMSPESLRNSGLEVGDPSVLTIEAQQIMDGRVVGVIDELPTLTDPRRQGFVVTDFMALSAALSGPADWTFGDRVPARVIAPQELWVKTDDTERAIRQLGVDPEDTPVLTLAGAAAAISSRPVQVGLVAILFVGAATSVALALAGVTSYVVLAVTRRTKEMGVLRALGFPRRGVAVTFAAEQVVVLGLGALVGTLGGIGLTWAMLPFLQLGETAAEIRPPVILDVSWPILAGYVAAVAVLMIASVMWATRRVSARRMSEVLREVER